MPARSATVVTHVVTLPPDLAALPRHQQRYQNIGECLYRASESGIIYALLKINGKQVRRSLDTTEIGAARLKRDALRLELSGTPVASLAPQIQPEPLPANPMSRQSFTEVGKLWLATRHDLKEKTKELRDYSIRTVAQYFGDRAIAEISRLDCEKWAAEQTGHSRTFNLHLETLKMTLEYAVLHKAIAENPAEHIDRKSVRYAERIIPTKEQFVNILATIRTKKKSGAPPSNDAADLVEALGWLGLRQGEANSLRWSDVDFDKKLVKVNGTKTDNAKRSVPLFQPVEALFKRMKTEQEPKVGDPVFKVESAKRPLATACKLLGIPKLNDHYSLRHLAATQWLECGCSIKSVSKWLGHSPRDGGALALRTYLHLRVDFEQKEVERVR